MNEKKLKIIKFYFLLLLFIVTGCLCFILPFVPVERFQPFLISRFPDKIIIGKEVEKVLSCITLILITLSLGLTLKKKYREWQTHFK